MPVLMYGPRRIILSHARARCRAEGREMSEAEMRIAFWHSRRLALSGMVLLMIFGVAIRWLR
jgi:hypothetical protein